MLYTIYIYVRRCVCIYIYTLREATITCTITITITMTITITSAITLTLSIAIVVVLLLLLSLPYVWELQIPKPCCKLQERSSAWVIDRWQFKEILFKAPCLGPPEPETPSLRGFGGDDFTRFCGA